MSINGFDAKHFKCTQYSDLVCETDACARPIF